jgi:hypothetical protein
MSYVLVIILFTVLMLPGLVGTVLPVLPGLPYMFIIALIYGISTKFIAFTTTELFILGMLVLLGLLATYFSGLFGAFAGGASKNALKLGTAGLLVGLIASPPLGAIAGLYLGILLGQATETNNPHQAIKAANGGIIGTFAGILINLLLGAFFIILFLIFAFTR